MHGTMQDTRFPLAVAGGGLMSLGLFLLMHQLIAGHPFSSAAVTPPPGIEVVKLKRQHTVVEPPPTPPTPPHRIKRPPTGMPLTPVNPTPVPRIPKWPGGKESIPSWPAPDTGVQGAGNAALQVRFRTRPLYPPTAAYQGVEGSITACFTVTATGAVTDPYVAGASSPRARRLLGAAALSAVMQWKFVPRRVGGQNTATPGVCQVIRFRLDGQ